MDKINSVGDFIRNTRRTVCEMDCELKLLRPVRKMLLTIILYRINDVPASFRRLSSSARARFKVATSRRLAIKNCLPQLLQKINELL